MKRTLLVVATLLTLCTPAFAQAPIAPIVRFSLTTGAISPQGSDTIPVNTKFTVFADEQTQSVPVTGYRLYRNGTLLATVTTAPSGPITFEQAAGWPTAGQYAVVVAAYNNDGEGLSLPLTLTVTSGQPPPACSYQVTPAAHSVSAAAGSVLSNVTASAPTCTWRTVSQAAWLTVSGTNVTGNGAASVNVAANTSSGARSGTIQVQDTVTTSIVVSITVSQAAPAPPQPLPAPWVARDIGAPSPAGSSSFASGTFTLRAGGVLWGAADAFHYVAQPRTGDFDIIARVGSLVDSDPWAKAGVMIRATDAAGSINAFFGATPVNGWTFQRRLATGGATTGAGTSRPPGTAPGWVKLTRRANVIASFFSADGVTWAAVLSDTLALPATVNVGLAIASDGTGSNPTATISDVSVTVPTPPLAACNDKVDNDGDKLIDFPNDPGCTSAQDTDETNAPPAVACADGIDNDGDTLIDLADPGCTSATDTDEFNAPPPPPAAQIQSATAAPSRCRITVTDVPPTVATGWSVRFRFNNVNGSFTNIGLIDSTAPYTQTSGEVLVGPFNVSAVWSRTGSAQVIRAPRSVSCPQQ